MSFSPLHLLIFLFPLAYSPGPGNLFFAGLAAGRGIAATLAPLLGYHLATFGLTLILGLSLSELSAMAPILRNLLTWAGGAYILWLAFGLWRQERDEWHPTPRMAGMAQGALLLALNPKAYIIILMVFSEFGTTSAKLTFWDAFIITAILTVNNLLAFILWSFAGYFGASALRQILGGSQIHKIFALLLAITGLWLLL